MERKTLQQWRKSRGISQLEMAFKMDMSLTTISNFENERTYPPIDVAIKLVNILDITLNDVIWIRETGDK